MTSFDFSNQFYNPYGTFNGAWNNNFNTGWNWDSAFTAPSSSSTTTLSSSESPRKNLKNETYEERKQRIAKEAEEALLKQKEAEQLAQLTEMKSAQIEEIEKQINEVDGNTKQINKNKKADGSSSMIVKRKDQGLWGKLGRWCSNGWSAIKSMGKSFAGYDKNGKWSLKKCLTNVGIAAAAVGACFIPVVGPFIGYGLAATGIAMGGVSVAKGVKNLKKAERSGDDAAIDRAQQEILGGAFVGATSAIGLKGMGSGFRTGVATASKASSAAERSSTLGGIWQSISNFGRDITVNAWRATKTAASNDMTAVAANGFFKSWGTKISSAYKGLNNKETRYENQRVDMNMRIDNKLAKVESDIQRIEALGTSRGSLTSAEQRRLALLKEERILLNENKAELDLFFNNNTCERSLYDGLKTDNSAIRASKSVTERSRSTTPDLIQGQKIPQDQLQMFNTRNINEQNKYSKALTKLIKAKEEKMRYLAKSPDKNLLELSQYVPSPNVTRKWYKLGDLRKNEYQLAIGGKNSSSYGEFAKITLFSPTTVAPKVLGNLDPIYSTPFMFGQDFTAQEVEETLSNLEAQRKELEAQLEIINNIKTVDEWNALQKQIQDAQKQQEQAQAQAQGETQQEGESQEVTTQAQQSAQT